MGKMLFHITFNDEWQKAVADGKYTPVEYFSDGFVFACYQEQLAGIANFLFRDYKKVLVLEIDPALLDCDVREVMSVGGGQLVPQIHGAIPVDAVVRTFYYERENGKPYGDGTYFGGQAPVTPEKDLPWYRKLFS
ncbi:MAG TPA: DUF952 domain-containing protein [Pseudomonadales bacterium]|nr:DUF952 domain-containing protein [Pseudomonadales bacterium]